MDYNGYSSGLTFNVHKGVDNGGTGTFADNWPSEVVQAVTIDNKGNTGMLTANPTSTLDVNGAFATALSIQTGSSAITLDNTAAVWYFTGSSSVTLPAASTCTNRRYTVVNRSSSGRTISSYTSLSGIATTAMAANSSIEIISTGVSWYQIR